VVPGILAVSSEEMRHALAAIAPGPSVGTALTLCHSTDPQIPSLRPAEYARISKRQKNVSRAYGGARCAGCVRNRWRTLLHTFPTPLRPWQPEHLRTTMQTPLCDCDAAYPG